VRFRHFLAIFFLVVVPFCSAADLNFEKGRARKILDEVSRDIETNYFDSTFGGMNWESMVAESRRKIDAAQTTSEIYTAIFEAVNRLGNSHTMFMSPGRIVDINFGFNAKAYGDKIYIYEVKKKGAAEAAGLKAGDQIIGVNGFSASRDSFDLMMLYYRVLQPRSALQIIYSRDGGAPQTLRLDATVKQKPVVADMNNEFNFWDLLREIESDSEVTYRYNIKGDVGYLQIPKFIYDEEFSLNGLLKKVGNAKAIVVDLRGNPGGAIKGLSDLAGYFEPQPVVVADLVGRNKREQLKVKPRKPNFPVPMVILVDSQSFSCSELFARHFQREGRAVVVGDHTAGYATAALFYSHHVGVDTIVPYGVQVATARVIFPGNEDLEKKGVTPDQFCIPTGADLAAEKDPCRDKAYEIAAELAKKGTGALASNGK
jgi:C-terminal peptidase prc